LFTAAVADKELSESNLPLMAAMATVACALLLLTAAGVAMLVRRRRIQARARELDSDDSDVRFLTASDGDVQLDFTLATSLT
jgi:nitrate reductase gamma subunit